VLDNIEGHIKRELSGITIDFLINHGGRMKWLKER